MLTLCSCSWTLTQILCMCTFNMLHITPSVIINMPHKSSTPSTFQCPAVWATSICNNYTFPYHCTHFDYRNTLRNGRGLLWRDFRLWRNAPSMNSLAYCSRPTGPSSSFLHSTELTKYSLSLCKIWGFHGGDYEECPLLGYKNPVHTSRETYYICCITQLVNTM
jgi:hypothetical protein